MRRVFLWAARNSVAEGTPAADAVHAPRRPTVHARRDARGRPGRGRSRSRRPGSARCTPGSARTSRTSPRPRKSPPTTSRPSTGSRRPGSPARSRSSRPSSGSTTTPTPASPTSSRSRTHAAATGSYLWIDMEGSAYTEATIALYERLRAIAAADRDLPAGVPAPDGRRHRAPAAARSGDPPGQGRLRREGVDRLPRQAPERRLRTTSASRSGSCSTGAGRPIRLGLGTHDVGAHRADRRAGRRRPGSGATASRSRCCTASGATSSTAWRRPATASRPLIAYGEHWYPWYMRRLAERPANVWFALRQMLP